MSADTKTPAEQDESGALQLIRVFAEDRWLAHRRLFRHRHPDESCDAHRDMVSHIHSLDRRLSIEGFRGLGKTTLLEEAVILKAGLREFRNLVWIGASMERAADRLDAIKAEILQNELLEEIFGLQRGPAWQDNRIVLPWGSCIQTLGRGQQILGLKFRDWRPDAFVLDDIEDPEEKRSDHEREDDWNWLMRTFLPALDDPILTWGRFLGTRRGTNSLAERLEKSGVTTKRYPIEHRDGENRRTATWPAKFPLPKVDAIRAAYRGDLNTYEQEYMCLAWSEAQRVFTPTMLRCEARVRGWQATFAMYDPARTANRRSATTGKAVWSWDGSRLTFWEVGAERWLPDQIVADLFLTQERYDCTWIGFEETGLSEWAKQPIRAEMVRRGVTLPLLPVNAPRGKQQFIAGLQPFAAAGEVVFAGAPEAFAVAFEQFLSFPSEPIDAPNACAYALRLRAGDPVYEGFEDDNIDESLEAAAGQPLYLAANADGALVTAILVQRARGQVRVLADWVREGSPSDVVGDIHAEARLAAETTRVGERWIYGEGEHEFKLPIRQDFIARLPLRWVMPAWHGDLWRNVGLLQAVRAIPQGAMLGEEGDGGRVELAGLLQRHQRGRPALLVSPQAKWTLRAFAGGYARPLSARGVVGVNPQEGIYALLMAGLEAFAGVGRTEKENEEDDQPIAHDRRGVPYRSVMPARR